MRGAADVYTATIARERELVVITADPKDFSKIDGVEYVVGWQ